MWIFLIVTVSCFDFSAYPPLYKVPEINPEWTTAVLRGKPVPNLPIRTPGEDIDWTPDITNCTQSYRWALSYDDGPSPYTHVALDALKANDITATFFVIGSQVAMHPDVLARAFREGHSIGIHTWSHPFLTTLTNDQIVAEVLWTAKIIRDVIGITPSFMRPPFGDIDNRVRGIMNALNLKIVMWDHDTFDWTFALGKSAPVNLGASSLTSITQVPSLFQQWVNSSKTRSGISLEHDLYKITAAEIPDAIEVLKKSVFKIVDIPQCIGLTVVSSDDPLIRANVSMNPMWKVNDVDSGVDPNGPGYYSSPSSRLSICPLLLFLLLIYSICP